MSARLYTSYVNYAMDKVPEDEVQLEEELVHCVMILLNKPQGLMTLEASAELLPLLAVRGCFIKRAGIQRLLTLSC